MVKFVNFDPS